MYNATMDPYEFCIAKAKEAGEMILRLRGQGFSTESKGGNARDIVTSVDQAVSAFLVDEIAKAFPEDSIYSEESDEVLRGARVWTIDPIDGSSNFSRGIPHFSVVIGLLQEGTPLAGAVYDPSTRELFSFKKDKGAYLNGVPITISAVTELEKAQVLFSPGSRQRTLWDWAGGAFRALLEHTLKRGVTGSSALDICYVAAGRAELAIYSTLTTLDIAPALGILEEAGGCAQGARGEKLALSAAPQKVYLANSQTLLEEVRTLLES